MPLTPLHLAAGLPARRWIDLRAFILINLLIDIEPAGVLFFNMDKLGYAVHGWSHTFEGMLALCVPPLFLSFFMKKNNIPWILGIYWGMFSHLFLDSLVHPDMKPFNGTNPLFLDAYHPVSGICAVILIYYLTVWVISLRIGEVAPRWFNRFRR